MPIEQTNLIFLTNELQDPRRHRELRVPLEFIRFGFVEGRLYHHYQNKGTFVVQNAKQRWGNDVVYGGLFLLHDFHYYIRTLDAYQGCSLSALMRNHSADLHHRHTLSITPITFSTMEEFCTLRYEEAEPILAHCYVGNLTQPKLTHQVHKRRMETRIVQGVDVPSYTELLREVLHV
jgi:hypothetical protein